MTLTNAASVTARAQNRKVTDDTDPAAPPTRRTFTPDQKLAILTAYDEATELGAKGALLRPEGIYSSQITEWKKAREAGSLAALGAKPRGVRSTDAKEADRLRKKNKRLEAELKKTRTALDIVGKAHALLEMLSESADTEEK
jgi:transposase-like protein